MSDDLTTPADGDEGGAPTAAAVLTHISIRNVALIESLDVRLAAGLVVVTGETGAGKSLLVEALALGLGGRALPSM